MKNKLERRTIRTEVRAKASDDGARHIEGYASMFNQPYTIPDWFGEFTEIIDRHAFDRCLSENPDVRCLFNHDANWILGRTKSKTLTLSADDSGLAYNCVPASGPLVTHVTDSIDRGDVDGSSFGFIVRKDSWVDENDESGRITKTTRTILDADIFDVSPVVFPANPGTSAGMRSLLWPEGMPAEVRSRFAKSEKRNADCECDCPECKDGNCADCSNPDCEDPNCEGGDNDADDRSKPRHKGHQHRAQECACDCAECKAGNCDDCTNGDCEDENCRCMNRSLSRLDGEQRKAVRSLLDGGLRLVIVESRGDAKTKKVDGADLTSECFAYVGDPDKTSTWKLPIKFPGDDEKTKTHIRNAIARFSSTKGIPEGEKDKVWSKIVAAAKEHDIEVSEENSAVEAAEIERRKDALRLLQAEL